MSAILEVTSDIPSDVRKTSLFVDVAALLANGLPEPPKPVLLRRTDGQPLLYAGKVNILFGDPEAGKSWIAYAAVTEALRHHRRAAIVDVDHNGALEIISRLIILGADPRVLGNPGLFRLAEPEDRLGLLAVVEELRSWKPAAVVFDSIGEIIPMLQYSSNSPDDFTTANRLTLSAMAASGAVVLGIDHLPKGQSVRALGQTGTVAKHRTVNGVSIRVSVAETFIPGRGGSAFLTIWKDRPGGLRSACPCDEKTQIAGRFIMEAQPDGGVRWCIRPPRVGETAKKSARAEDVAALDTLDPPPRSQRDVQQRMKWGASRAMTALRAWRTADAPDEA